jgi:hypothetical protein
MFGLSEQKKDSDPARFWQEYEENCGEKVLAYTLGQYLSGWDEFTIPLWGLLIVTEGGFRFHHFPHEGWIQTLSRISSGGEAPKEKTIFIPNDKIVSVELRVEKSLLKRVFLAGLPKLVVRYGDKGGELVLETDRKAEKIISSLNRGQ